MNQIIKKHYRGVTDKNSLLWCHGQEGIEHQKIRKYRYPFYKYNQIDEIKIIVCICKNCNMTFYGELAKSVPLSIRVKYLDDYFPYSIDVTVNGKKSPLVGMVMKNRYLGNTNQEMITDLTREFIEKVQ